MQTYTQHIEKEKNENTTVHNMKERKKEKKYCLEVEKRRDK